MSIGPSKVLTRLVGKKGVNFISSSISWTKVRGNLVSFRRLATAHTVLNVQAGQWVLSHLLGSAGVGGRK